MDLMSIINSASQQNPMISHLVALLKKGNSSGVETFARNIMKERGRDFDKEYAEFKRNFKLR